ncbi:MAG: hypothetical protein QOI20_2840 [Acidimicrobiaceae bacterium]|jgi:hypothetical protein|nr:hypothetical protein [Acidimicrobiaceae bacterium]
MSVAVDLAELAEHIESFGPVAYLVTTGEGGGAHVVSVMPVWNDDELSTPAGRSTSANVAANGRATLLWPAASGADYCLLVDETGRVVEDPSSVAVRPTRAVLHRLPQADASLPSCVTVL